MTATVQAPAPRDERTPPHNPVAEQSVLGGMLLSKDAIAEATEHLGGADFYRPLHETIYTAIVKLYSKGEPADATTVLAALAETGDLVKLPGGAAYLHTLIAAVPTAANTGYYARIVADQAQLRRLVAAGTRIAQIGYQPDGNAKTALDRASAAFHDATTAKATTTARRVGPLVRAALNAIEDAGNHTGLRGLSTGISDLDKLLGGLRPGQLIIVAGRPGMGKALALDTALPTPTGWTTMGDVRVGDLLLGADGRPTRVLAATEVMHGRPCFEIHFSDGAVIVADAEHQWLTETRAARVSANMAAATWSRARVRRTGPSVRTTAEIAATVRCATADRRLNHSVPLARPFELPDAALPIDPYVLGVWLGDGHSYSGMVTSADPEIPAAIEQAGYRVTRQAGPYAYGVLGLSVQLRAASVLQNKHIPPAYLRASERQRRSLLAGLLDTDGSVANGGKSVRFEVTSRVLAEGAHELILSLGYRCVMTTKRVRGRTAASSTVYRLTFSPGDKVFRLTRKAARQALTQTCRATSRYITDVRPVASVPVRCVQVDNDDHLYLAGQACIPTHNSVLAVDIARAVAFRARKPFLYFSLEMGELELTTRILAAECAINLTQITHGTLTDDHWTRLAHAAVVLDDAPLHIDETAELTILDIRAKARRMHQQHGIVGIAVDYLQLMSTPGTRRNDSREREVADISRGLKLLAKELAVPVVAVAQLNRGPEQRNDKRPHLSDLRESGSLEQDADVVLLLHRDEYYNKDSSSRRGEVDIDVAKNRNGTTGVVTAAAQLHFARIRDMASNEYF